MRSKSIIILIFITIVSGCNDNTKSVMTNEYQLPKGINVNDLSGIREAYSVRKTADGYFVFTINVSSENILRVFKLLASRVKEPAFFLLETGTHEDVEKKLRKDNKAPFHKDIYYVDGLEWSNAESILNVYEELLVHDGGINFGFGSHQGRDEVFIGPYKIFEIYADEPKKYISILNELKIVKVDQLKTVWDNFTQNSPGNRRALTDAETTIWQMIEQLKEKGLYFAERRED